jgi:O-antigen/teichoic acid export membrane protein
MRLREKVLRGGVYLVVRQGLGLILGLGGVVLLSRAIGPANYGLYASALGIVSYLGSLAGLGVNVYLVRLEFEPDRDIYNQAFTLTFITGLCGILLGIASVPFLQHWLKNPDFIPPMLAMLPALPFIAMIGPVMARLERDLNYRAVASIELAGQIIFYLVSLTMAYQGKGVWAPVAGYLTWQIYQLAAACAATRYRPRPFLRRLMLGDMLRYSAGYSASIWIWQLRSLINPLFVGRYAGPEGVGYVALAIRLVEALSFVKAAAWRLSIATMGKLQTDVQRLQKFMEEATILQVLVLGLVLTSFAWIAPALFPFVFGDSWNSVLTVYPFIALGYLINAAFSMHSSVLYVYRRNWEVALFHVLHIILFAGGVLFLAPRFGPAGYGMAEVPALLSYIVIHFQVVKVVNPSCIKTLPWLISFIPPLFTPLLQFPFNLLLLLPLVVCLFIPAFNIQLIEYGKMLKSKTTKC